MPLFMLHPGVRQSIKQIRGRDDIRRFLESLGFVVGGNVTVISEMGGNIIVNVKDTRIAINKSMASKIIV